METLAFHFLALAGAYSLKMWSCSLREGTELVAHLIPKLTQIPSKYYKYHQMEQEAHYSFCFQENVPYDLLQTEKVKHTRNLMRGHIKWNC